MRRPAQVSQHRHLSIALVGKDRPGLVAQATRFLFDRGVNIDGIEQNVLRGRFNMAIEASWEEGRWSPDQVGRELEELAGSLEMTLRFRCRAPGETQRFALFVTREDHVLRGILEEIEAGSIRARPVVVISNHGDLAPLAGEAGLDFELIEWSDRRKAEDQALACLERHQADFLVLARFMRILTPHLVWHFKNRIINIHPSLLPSFPGPQPYRQAWEHGVKVAGVTAHFVDMHLDEGPIIAQESFEVAQGMSLREMVLAGRPLETRTMVRAIQLYLSRNLDVHWGRVQDI